MSRTTVIRVPKRLAALGVIASEATGFAIIRRPEAADCFAPSETPSIEETLESTSLSMIGCHELAPGASRRILSAPAIREFLIDLNRFGFVCREAQRYGYRKAQRRNMRWNSRRFVFFSNSGQSANCAKSAITTLFGAVRSGFRSNIWQSTRLPILRRCTFRLWIPGFTGLSTRRLMIGFQDEISLIFNCHFP